MNTSSIRIANYLGIATVILLPLLGSNRFIAGSTFIKTSFFIIMVQLMFVLWLPSAFDYLKKRGFSMLSLFLFLFIALAFIVSLLSDNFSHSFWSSYERMAGLWTMVHLFIFFLIIGTTIIDKQQWLRFFYAIVISSTLVAIIGIPQYEVYESSGAFRIQSTFSNASFLASYLVLSFFCGVYLVLRNERWHLNSGIFSVASLVILLALILTQSRGAMLALSSASVLFIALFLIWGPTKGYTCSIKNTFLKKIATIIIILFLLLLTVGIIFKNKLTESSFEPLRRFASISVTDRTVSARLLTWGVAWQGIKEKPVLGWGTENFNQVFDKHYVPELFHQEAWFDRAHNIFFDVGVAYGFVGLFVYIGIFVSAILMAVRTRKKEILSFLEFAVIVVILVAHWVMNFFTFEAISSQLTLFIILAFIHSQYLKVKIIDDTNVRSDKMYMVMGTILLLPLLYIGIWRPMAENYLGKRGLDNFSVYQDGKAIDLIEQALSYNTYGDVYIRSSVAEYTFEYLKDGGIRTNDELKNILDYSIRNIDENIIEEPDNVKWLVYSGRLNNFASEFLELPSVAYALEAERRFTKAMILSPNRPQIHLGLARSLVSQGKYDDMWAAVREAERLLPNSELVHINSLVFAIKSGDLGREEDELMWLLTNYPTHDLEYLRDAYLDVGRWGSAAEAQLLVIQAQLEDPASQREDIVKYLSVLAALYQKDGQYTNAKIAAEKVLEFDPNQEIAVQKFISELPVK